MFGYEKVFYKGRPNMDHLLQATSNTLTGTLKLIDWKELTGIWTNIVTRAISYTSRS